MTTRKSLAALTLAGLLAITACGSAPDENTNDDKHIKGMDAAAAITKCHKAQGEKLNIPLDGFSITAAKSTQITNGEEKHWYVVSKTDSGQKISCTVHPISPDKAEVKAN